jgi:arginyl-tRNA synthetase
MYFENIIATLYPQINHKDYFLQEGNYSDFAFNKVNALSKVLNKSNDIIIEEIVKKLEDIEFISFYIKDNKILINLTDEHLSNSINDLLTRTINNNNLPIPEKKKIKCLIDFAGCNVAKEMHVGHLRSIIIGESLSRIYEYMGDIVIRRNHVGDWGTQLGMLIAYIKNNKLINYDISDLTKMYKESKICFDSSEEFKTQAREETYLLQQDDETNKKLWENIVNLSISEFNNIFNSLNCTSEIKGESFYQPYMIQLLKDVQTTYHEGMKVIFAEQNQNHLILEKKDGAFTYDTSDLAAIRYRINEEKVDKIIYVVDISQQIHFETLFLVAKNLNFVQDQTLEYAGIGLVWGPDGKKMKTRSGETMKLSDLLLDAFNSALTLTKELIKDKNMQENEIIEISRKIAFNCIKYADLSCPRINSYKYDIKKMLNTKGNTAVYLMYAMARCKSILSKVNFSTLSKYEIKIDSKEARNLIFLILKYQEILFKAYNNSSPHYICNYLYNLVLALTKFYETNRCLEIKDKKICYIYEHRICIIHLSVILINRLFSLIGLEDIEQI